MKIYIDIETVPVDMNPDLKASLTAGLEAPSNYKDKEKIAAYIEASAEKLVNSLALKPFWAEPICICAETDAEIYAEVNPEQHLLESFAKWLSNLNGYDTFFVGYNIVKFDLPVLAAAMVRARVPVPTVLSRAIDEPYKQVDYMRMFPNAGKLGAIGDLLGVPKLTTYIGADVGELYDEGHWGSIKQHCQDDIKILKRIGEWI